MTTELPTVAKIVAVLLTDVVSSTQHLTHMGDEAWNAERGRHFGLLREELARHDGVEVKNTGDGILAVFPSAVDAVRAATAMQQAVERDCREHPGGGLEMKVGLHVGEPVHEESDFFGEAMVLVTRLCDAAAPGQILASALMRALVASRHDLVFEQVGPLTLKGLPAPVEAYEVQWSPLTPTSYLDPLTTGVGLSRFVDRDEQRATIAEWYRTAFEGQRTFGIVSGEAGIGKSRLVSEAALQAHADGATVLWGRCFEESIAPHGAFVDALRRLIAWVESNGTALPGVSAAARQLVSLSAVFGPAGRDLDGHDDEPLVEQGSRDGGGRLRLFDAVEALLHELAQVTPVVLVLDDLQWADEATLLLLSHLVRSAQSDRLLVLGTVRDGDADRARSLRATLADLRREHRVRRVRLSGLAESAAGELIQELAGRELPPEVARRVRDQTEGNPFFIEEVMAHLEETRAFEALDAPAAAPLDLETVELPEGVAEVVGRRLARLGEETGAILGVAAVVGREFDLHVVEAVSNHDLDRVVDALDDAIKAGLLAEDAELIGRYRFTHTLVRRTLMEDLSATRRAHLHHRISQVMEGTIPDGDIDPKDDADRQRLLQLAHHSLAAVPLGDPWRAAHHARRAGEQALSELAYEQAVALFDRAMSTLDGLVPPDREALSLRARIRLGSGEARVLAGDFNGARDVFRQAIDDADELDDGEVRARATLGFGRALGSGVGFEFGVPSVELVDLLGDALEGLPKGDSEIRAMLTARLGAALGSSSDPSRAVVTAREALAMAERIGSPATIASCLISLRAAGWGRIEPDEQRRLGTRIVQIAAAAGEPLLELHGRVWQIADAFEDGDVDAAAAANEEIAKLVERIRLPQFSWYLELYGATRALLDGDVDRAEATSLQALARGESMGDLNVELAFGAQTVLQWMERGWLDQLIPIAQEQVEELPGVAAWVAVLAISLLAGGRVEEARAAMADAMDQLRATPPGPLQPVTLALLIDVAARLGDAEAAAELYDQLSPHQGRIVMIAQMAGSFGAASHHLGVAAATAGRPDQALHHLRRAVDEHRSLRAPAWEARSLLAMAEVLLDRGGSEAEEVPPLVEHAAAAVEDKDLPELHRRLELVRERLEATRRELEPVS